MADFYPAVWPGFILAGTHNSQRATHNSQLVVPTYVRVSYRGIYRGIDLVYHGTAGRLEYDWLLHPGAAVRRIRLAISGVRHLRLAHDGTLLLVTSAGTLRQARPHAYQTVHGHRHSIAVRYVLLGHGRVGLRLGRYDHHHALVIDPVLSYGSYLGGSGTDQATAVALDQRGDLFLTGYTTSADFITTTTAYSTSQASGNYDVFITEISPTGAVSYSTYLGGSSFDYGEGIAVDPAGNAYVTGLTNSSDFPTTTSLYSVHTGLNTTQTLSVSVPATGTDAFVVRLIATGALSYSVRLGSLGGVNALGDTWGRAIAVAPEGQGSSTYDAYVTGQTDSPDFPVTTLSPVGTTRGLPQSPHGVCTQSVNPLTSQPVTTELGTGPCYDAFVVRLTADGSGFVYSTYLGGGQDDMGYGIVADASGNAIVTGRTTSADFPVSGTLQSFDNAPVSGTLQQLNGLLGGLGLSGISLNTSTISGSAPQCNETNCPDAFVVALSTTAPGLPVGVAQPLWELSGPVLGQLQAVSTTLSTLGLGQPGALLGPPSELWGTYLGGQSADEGRGIAVDPRGNVYVTGATSSSDFTTTTGAYTTTFTGATCANGLPCSDAFVVKLPPDGSRLVYSSRFGGAGADTGNAIAVDSSGHAYVTGQTSSPDFPLLGSLQPFAGTHAISSTASYTTSMAFVVRMNKQGSGRFYSSYLGGSGGDAGSAIAVDGIGDVMLAGSTGSTDFLTLTPQQAQNKGGQDAYVSGIDATTRHLTYAYDGLDRLDGVSETLGNTYAYSYDIAGNRTDEWLNGVDIQHAQFDQASELITLTTPQSGTTIQSYDAAGNLTGDATNQYSYDALDRLSTLTPLTSSAQTSYTYNGDGVLVAQATGSQTPTLYTQDLATSQSSLNMPPPPPPAAYPSVASPLEPPTAPAQPDFSAVSQQPAVGAQSGFAALGGFASAAGSFAAPPGAAPAALGGTGGTVASGEPASGGTSGSSFVGQGGGGSAGVSLAGQVAGGASGASFASQSLFSRGTAGASFSSQAQFAGSPGGLAAPSAQDLSTFGQGAGAFGQPGTSGPSALVATQNQALLSGGQYVPLQPQSVAAGMALASQLSAAASPLQLALSSPTLATPESAGGLSQVLQTTQGSATTDYLYGLERLASLSGGNHTWYVTDLQGSVRYTQNDSGGSAGSLTYDPQPLRYDPYGAVDRGADGDGVLPQTFGYRSEVQDPNTGLIDLRARMYNPATDQFLTRDPLVQQTDQPYVYAGGDPVNKSDPRGQASNNQTFIEVAGPETEAAIPQIRQALIAEYQLRHPQSQVLAPVPPPGVAPTIPPDLLGRVHALPRADFVSLSRVRDAQGHDTGQMYDLLPDSDPNAPLHTLFPTLSGVRGSLDELEALQIVAAKQGLTRLCAPVDLTFGTDYTTPPGPYVATVQGQSFTQIPVLTSAGEYIVFGRQYPTYDGLIFYSLCRPARPGESGVPCRAPVDDKTNPCAFTNGVACTIDLVIFGGSLSALARCNSFASCGLSVLGVLASTITVGSIVAHAFDTVAVRAAVGAGGVDALEAQITDQTVGRVSVGTADNGIAVSNEAQTLDSTQLRTFLDDLECKCFPAGTQVATRTGSVSIEKLHVGDEVLAEDPVTGKVEPEPVLALIVRPVSPMIEVDLSDGSTIKVQPDHPFWVDSGQGLHGKGWLKAGQLRPGDRLRTASGKDVVVVRVRRHAGRAVVYTLTVAHDHTFFVGSARVLVHNCPLPITGETDAAKQFAADVRAGDKSLRPDGDFHGESTHMITFETAVGIVKAPGIDGVYLSVSKTRNLIFLKDGTIVVVKSGLGGNPSSAGNVLTAYGKLGIKGDSGAAALGGSPSDPGIPVTEADILNGTIPSKVFKNATGAVVRIEYLPKAVKIGPPLPPPSSALSTP